MENIPLGVYIICDISPIKYGKFPLKIKKIDRKESEVNNYEIFKLCKKNK